MKKEVKWSEAKWSDGPRLIIDQEIFWESGQNISVLLLYNNIGFYLTLQKWSIFKD